MRRDTSTGGRWRLAAVLAGGVAIGTMMIATPAGGHVGGTIGHLFGHLRPLLDERYVRSTDTLSIPGTAFQPLASNTAYSSCSPGGVQGVGMFAAPVHLPSGVNVRRLTFHWSDFNGMADASLELVRTPTPAVSSETTMATVSSAPPNGTSSSSTTTITNPTVNNAEAHYVVRVDLPASTCVSGVEIRYSR